jgi:GMP synthase-like glutamine amidotransferase
MKSIAFIDNFKIDPINHCVNEILLRNNMPCTYHQPARFGMESLKRLDRFDALVILGSASNVTEPEAWHNELLDFVIPHIENNVPTLALCFGHQLMVHHFGGVIDYVDSEHTYYQVVRELSFNQKVWGREFGGKFPMPYSHEQCVKEISDDFEVIASTRDLKYEGLKHKKYNLWTFQGHPESSREFLEETLKLSNKSDLERVKTQGNQLLDTFANFVKSTTSSN